jgi:hypothetical protein
MYAESWNVKLVDKACGAKQFPRLTRWQGVGSGRLECHWTVDSHSGNVA